MRRRGFVTAVLVFALAPTACSNGVEATPTGPGWSIAHTSTQWWMSVYSPPSGDSWIVGGTTSEGAILRYDGTTFTEVDHGADVGLLNWIHGFPSGEMVVVGNDGAVLRYDGSAWTQDAPVTDQDLWGVWGAAPDDLWAVGGDADGTHPTILRDTGSGFVEIDVPDLQRPGVGVFFKVWGSGPGDVYVVGQSGAVLHWDGSALEELFVGVSQDLIGVWGTGPDRVITVGGRRNGAAAIWDGTAWTNPDLGRYSGINGVWVGDGLAYVVGDAGSVGTIDLATGEASITRVETPVSVHAVSGAGGRLIAVGGDFATGPQGPFLGQVLVAAEGP